MKADFVELDSNNMYESEDFDDAKNNFNSFVNDIYESERDIDELEDFIRALKDSVHVHVTGRFTLKLDTSEIHSIPVHDLKRFTSFEIRGIHDYRNETHLRIQYKG